LRHCIKEEKYQMHELSKLVVEAESSDAGVASGGVFVELMQQLRANGGAVHVEPYETPS